MFHWLTEFLAMVRRPGRDKRSFVVAGTVLMGTAIAIFLVVQLGKRGSLVFNLYLIVASYVGAFVSALLQWKYFQARKRNRDTLTGKSRGATED